MGVEEAGGKGTIISAPLAGVGYLPVIATALDLEPDAVALSMSGTDAGRVILGLRSAGYDGLITGANSVMQQGTLDVLGPKNGSNIVLASRGLAPTSTDNAEISAFSSAMLAEDPEVNVDDIGLNGWLSVKLFADVITGHEITDGASVIQALDAIDQPIGLGGAYADYPGIQDPPPLPGLPTDRDLLGRHERRRGRGDRARGRALRPVRRLVPDGAQPAEYPSGVGSWDCYVSEIPTRTGAPVSGVECSS